MRGEPLLSGGYHRPWDILRLCAMGGVFERRQISPLVRRGMGDGVSLCFHSHLNGDTQFFGYPDRFALAKGFKLNDPLFKVGELPGIDDCNCDFYLFSTDNIFKGLDLTSYERVEVLQSSIVGDLCKRKRMPFVKTSFLSDPPGGRTLDPLIKSQLLYQLS